MEIFPRWVLIIDENWSRQIGKACRVCRLAVGYECEQVTRGIRVLAIILLLFLVLRHHRVFLLRIESNERGGWRCQGFVALNRMVSREENVGTGVRERNE